MTMLFFVSLIFSASKASASWRVETVRRIAFLSHHDNQPPTFTILALPDRSHLIPSSSPDLFRFVPSPASPVVEQSVH